MGNSERFARPKALVGPKLVGLLQILDRNVEPGGAQIRPTPLFPP